MSNIYKQKSIYYTILSTGLLSLFLPFFNFPLGTIFFILLFSLILLLSIHNPFRAILATLFIRPLLDNWSNLNLFPTFPLELNPAAALSLIVPLIFLMAINNKAFFQFPLKTFWLFFLLSLFISIPFSINLTASLLEFYRIATFLIFFLLGVNVVTSKKQQKTLVKTIILSSLLPIAVAIWQFFNKSGFSLGFDDVPNRLISTFGHPNSLAYFLILPTTLVAYQFIKKGGSGFFLIFLLQLFVIFGTYTRGAWLALTLVMIFLSLFRFRRFFLASLFFLMLSYLFVMPIRHRMDDFFAPGPGNSASWRMNLWKDSIKYFQQKPLNGFGIGTAEEAIFQYRGDQFGSTEPHNDYLRVLLETGIIGIASYLSLKLAIIKKLAQRKNLLASLFLSLFLSFSFAEGFDNILRVTALAWPFWTLLGSITPSSKTKKRDFSVQS